ncbi:MAG: flagellin FliC [Bdellovibrio sp.]|nr:flagellin FliC [Bdellovibrio sp.]
MSRNEKAVDRSSKNLATGSRLSDPSADVAGSAIAETMNSEIRSMGAAKENAEAGQSFVAVAEASMSEQATLLNRLRELSIQSASDTYSKNERMLMQKEAGELTSEFDRIAKTARFGSQNLLDGTVSKFDFQVGTKGDVNSRISYNSDANTTASALEIDSISVAEKGDALNSIDKIDRAMSSIAMNRAKFGATQSRLESAQNTLGSSIEKLSEARSKIADADVAKESSDLRRGQILQQYQTSMLQQTNERSGLALKLIG